MGRFQGLSGVKTNQGGLYFLQEGGQESALYLVELEEVKLIVNRSGVDCFIISGKVLESNNPDRGIGCTPAQVMTFRPDILETVLSNIKQFAGAVLGLEDPDGYLHAVDPSVPNDTPAAATERFWSETLETMVSEGEPCKGIKIYLSCNQILTKAKKNFTIHKWGPVVAEAAPAA